ncbi:polyprenyl synthetase family protein [Siminovitchia fortis]|uniref:Farnesyl diphosphate synthase n=2 Tax=Siminovitchia fortis TaxID=254758 RepID=A0A443J468_9BACI|nr:polyprenyl synthetase family protein [Siminovitchia fortis]
MEKHKEILNKELKNRISKLDTPPKLKEAMAYSLDAGGKRIRPLLLFAVIDSFGKDTAAGLSTAAALEMIHTYSLIHDDLPSMDNDDVRRGKLTNHKVFGEGMAILAGDGLLTFAFQLISGDQYLQDGQKVELLHLLSKCAGPEGMVAGQVADMEGENKELGIDELEYIHTHKTGKLLTFSVLAGATIGGADRRQMESFEQFSHHLGLSFQISDDILDVTGDEELMGKPVGSDTGRHKSTYPSVLTLKGAKEHLSLHIKEAKKALGQTNLNTEILSRITDLIADRTH